MNYEDQTYENNNEEETTKALGRSNHEDQTQTTKIKPKQQRLFPNNEDQTMTAKAPVAAAKAPVAAAKASFSSLICGFGDVPLLSSLVFGFVEVLYVPSFSSLVFGFSSVC